MQDGITEKTATKWVAVKFAHGRQDKWVGGRSNKILTNGQTLNVVIKTL